LSNESQYAWAKLAKSVIGTDNVDAQMGDGLSAELVLGLPRATIADVCAPGGTILVIGVDPKETHGSLFLRLRHAAENDNSTIIEVASYSTGLTQYATHSVRSAPDEIADVVAGLFSGDSDDPAAAGLQGPITVVCGPGSLATDRAIIEKAIATIAAAKPDARFLPCPHRGNVMGALDMGLAPGALPGRTPLGTTPTGWESAPETKGLDTEGMLRLAADGGIDVAILLGCDPLTDFPDAQLAEQAFNKVEHLIAVDCVLNFTSTGADIVFPAAANATEVDGTFTNIEGRVSSVSQKVTPPGTARPDWMIAAELAAHLGSDLGFIDLDELWADLGSASALHASTSLADVVAAGTDAVLLTGGAFDAPAADSIEVGETESTPGLTLVVKRKMYDEGTTLTFCPSLNQLSAGASAAMHPHELESRGVASGTNVSIGNDVGSITLSVAKGCVVVELNQPNANARRLLDASRIVTSVRVEGAS